MIRRLASALVLMIGLSACAVPPPKNYDAFGAAQPYSILVPPPINRSTDALAGEYLSTTIAKPLANRGYYVFPINLVRRVLEDDGLPDPEMVHAADPTHLGQLFGADTILYVTIEKWAAEYIVLDTIVTVDVSYILKETAGGTTIWEHRQQAKYNANAGDAGGGGIAGLLVKVVAAAITKAKPDYIRMSRQANTAAFGTPQQGLPPGPHFRDRATEKDLSKP
ncbi:putative lipoprotein [Paramagnetospirillum magnetotacticum MS-1]|uniref:Putative lipoprotein n=1 Tax=Paramagnetospirillum magnetotacticum MS-1 TaxID=272627 RepID=A0A0C2YDV9_PARME|nr:GNA1162 family protein [Paramagnetospirillum magnetotacticum]KIL97894.1 putative lipoprotein [Paramagnetospirillum magnetotacticum MS-1]